MTLEECCDQADHHSDHHSDSPLQSAAHKSRQEVRNLSAPQHVGGRARRLIEAHPD